jgi:hypothetical protein
LVLECNEPGGISAEDPQIENWLNEASALDECTEAELSNNAPEFFPVGCGEGQTTDVVFTATDECSNSSFEDSSITVVDTTPPVLTCSVDVDTLWPPNHGFVDVGFSFEVTDVCDPDISIDVSVSSDEDPALTKGAGSKNFCPDAIIGEDNSVQLRAERSGSGDGRVYEITITAVDSCGNSTSCSKVINVPANQGSKGSAIDSGQSFDATICSTTEQAIRQIPEISRKIRENN